MDQFGIDLSDMRGVGVTVATCLIFGVTLQVSNEFEEWDLRTIIFYPFQCNLRIWLIKQSAGGSLFMKCSNLEARKAQKAKLFK